MISLMGVTLDSTINLMSEMTKLTRILISRGNFGEEQVELVNRANEMIDKIEKFCVVVKKDCILFDDLDKKSQAEKIKFQDELLLVKKERDDFKEELARLKEDKRVKRLEERLAKNCEEQSHVRNEKNELNVKVTKLNNLVLEKDEMLNNFGERLKCMEMEVARKERVIKNLKQQNSTSLKSMEETKGDQKLNTCKKELKILEVKVARQEQELHDFKRQKLAAYRISQEKLKKQVLERDNMLNTCEEKLKCMEVKVAKKEQEIHDLKHEKSAAYQIINKLTHLQIETNQRAEESRHQYVEASENADELKHKLLAVKKDKSKSDEELKDIKEKQLEADTNLKELRQKNLVALQAVEKFRECTLAADEAYKVNRERWEGLPRIKTVEEGLIKVLKIKVLDLANSVLKEAVDVNSPIPKGGAEPLRVLTGINEGSGNEDDSFDQAGSQFHSSPPQVEGGNADLEDKTEKSCCSGTIATGEVACFDDEARPGESEYNSDLQVPLVEFEPKRKRSLLGNLDGNLPTTRQKTEPSQENDESLGSKSNTPNPVLRTCMEKAVAARNSKTQMWTSSSDSEEESSSGEESCSDSYMNNLVRIVRFENLRKTWKSESNILKDFQKDVELCMDAVCVLYRWKIRESDSLACSGVEVSHFDVMGGCSLAEYLINGDPDCRLKKFVSEVEEERPDCLVRCRKIATDYCEKLFSIYCNRNDPFFRS